MQGYYLDNQNDNVQEHFAVVRVTRRKRDRFAENCVTIFESKDLAIAAANKNPNIQAAKVLGPCRSSEGLRLFYLVNWLD